ncbi:hypothetical protein CsSME_00036610 [Camellia sinensis var. sinensis]
MEAQKEKEEDDQHQHVFPPSYASVLGEKDTPTMVSGLTRIIGTSHEDNSAVGVQSDSGASVVTESAMRQGHDPTSQDQGGCGLVLTLGGLFWSIDVFIVHVTRLDHHKVVLK